MEKKHGCLFDVLCCILLLLFSVLLMIMIAWLNPELGLENSLILRFLFGLIGILPYASLVYIILRMRKRKKEKAQKANKKVMREKWLPPLPLIGDIVSIRENHPDSASEPLEQETALPISQIVARTEFRIQENIPYDISIAQAIVRHMLGTPLSTLCKLSIGCSGGETPAGAVFSKTYHWFSRPLVSACEADWLSFRQQAEQESLPPVYGVGYDMIRLDCLDYQFQVPAGPRQLRIELLAGNTLKISWNGESAADVQQLIDYLIENSPRRIYYVEDSSPKH